MLSRPHRSLLPLLLMSLLSLATAGLHAQQAPTLQQRMGSDAFKQAGLDKLSPAELQSLQQWLSAHASELAISVPASEVSSAAAAAGSKPVQPRDGSGSGATRNDTVISHLAGAFNGWKPGTVLTLQNGQKWRISDDSSLDIGRSIDNPAVTIKPGLISGWTLKVQGYNSSARVEPAN